MTIRNINDIIKAVCPNDEDYEKPCISPKYLRQELEQLALDQEQKLLEHSLSEEDILELKHRYGDEVEYVVRDMLSGEGKRWKGCITCSLDEGDDCCRKLYEESIQEATIKKDLGVDCIDRAKAQTEIEMKASRYTIAKERGGMGQVEWSDQLIKVSDAVDIIRNLPSVTPQEPVLDKINKMKSEIADSLEFWDYSPNNNPLARDMLETITNFWGDIREVKG